MASSTVIALLLLSVGVSEAVVKLLDRLISDAESADLNDVRISSVSDGGPNELWGDVLVLCPVENGG